MILPINVTVVTVSTYYECRFRSGKRNCKTATNCTLLTEIRFRQEQFAHERNNFLSGPKMMNLALLPALVPRMVEREKFLTNSTSTIHLSSYASCKTSLTADFRVVLITVGALRLRCEIIV